MHTHSRHVDCVVAGFEVPLIARDKLLANKTGKVRVPINHLRLYKIKSKYRVLGLGEIHGGLSKPNKPVPAHLAENKTISLMSLSKFDRSQMCDV
jgi:hypothetical protein